MRYPRPPSPAIPRQTNRRPLVVLVVVFPVLRGVALVAGPASSGPRLSLSEISCTVLTSESVSMRVDRRAWRRPRRRARLAMLVKPRVASVRDALDLAAGSVATNARARRPRAGGTRAGARASR